MNEETINHFTSFGLTEYESKAIFSLIKKGSLQAPEISRDTGIPKTRVYDVLVKLEEKQLVIALQGRPKKFQAIETDKIIEKLIQEKRKELNKIEENALKLKKNLFSEEQEEKENVFKVKELNDFDRILGQELSKAEKSINVFAETNKRSFLEEALNNAIEKKIKVNYPEKKGINNAFIIDEKKIILALDDFQKQRPFYHFAVLQNKSLAKAVLSHFSTKQ